MSENASHGPILPERRVCRVAFHQSSRAERALRIAAFAADLTFLQQNANRPPIIRRYAEKTKRGAGFQSAMTAGTAAAACGLVLGLALFMIGSAGRRLRRFDREDRI